MKFQIPKGLFDILPYDVKEKWKFIDYWQYVESIIHELSSTFGFKEIRTPIFERAELFDRGVGKTSDIVSKEMYVFKDKANRLLALRPEGTSAVMRAYVENNLLNYAKNHKLYYISPMFRYERPQSGRYRQHFQFGAEVIGIENFVQDVEIIDMLWQFFKRLKLKNIELNINSIGDVSSREKYKSALISFLKPKFDLLSSDSKLRFEKNPLRILDSKDINDKKILQSAPNILDYLSESAAEHFKQVLSLLDELKIPYKINPNIVRGLDYYNHTVFEFLCSDLGSQSALAGGGRYDGFTTAFGGKEQPGVGFGAGLERIIQAVIAQGIQIPLLNNPFVFIIPLDSTSLKYAFLLMNKLRKDKIPVEMDLEFKKIANSLKKANQKNAKFVLVIGDEELKTNSVKLKNMFQRDEITVELDQVEEILKSYWVKK